MGSSQEQRCARYSGVLLKPAGCAWQWLLGADLQTQPLTPRLAVSLLQSLCTDPTAWTTVVLVVQGHADIFAFPLLMKTILVISTLLPVNF